MISLAACLKSVSQTASREKYKEEVGESEQVGVQGCTSLSGMRPQQAEPAHQPASLVITRCMAPRGLGRNEASLLLQNNSSCKSGSHLEIQRYNRNMHVSGPQLL